MSRREVGVGNEDGKVVKESFRFHRTNDIVRHSIIPTVCQRSYRDNIADDIIRIMFATAVKRKAGSPLRSRGGKRPRGKKVGQAEGGEEERTERVNFTRGRQKFRRTFKAFNIKRPWPRSSPVRSLARSGKEKARVRIAREVDPNLCKKNCIRASSGATPGKFPYNN